MNEKDNKKVLIIASFAPGYSISSMGTPLMLNRLLSFINKNNYIILAPKEDIKKELLEQFLKNGNYYYEGNFGKLFNLLGFNQISQIISIVNQSKNIFKKNNIKKVLAISYGPCFISAFILHKQYNLPYAVYIFDLWRDNFLKPIEKLFAIFFEEKILKNAENVITAGEGISNFLSEKYKIKPITINNSIIIKDEIEPEFIKKAKKRKTIMYAGSIYWAQIDSILNLIKAISDIEGIELHIYSFQKKEELIKRGIIGKNVYILPGVNEEKIKDLYRKADILFLPLSFSRKSIPIIKTAQPGKIADYLISGVPILVHSPGYAFISKYCQKYKFGILVDTPEPEKLKEAIKLILENKNNICNTLITNAFRAAKEFHDAQKNSQILENILFQS